MHDVSHADTSAVSQCGALVKSGTWCLSQVAHCVDEPCVKTQKKQGTTRSRNGLLYVNVTGELKKNKNALLSELLKKTKTQATHSHTKIKSKIAEQSK